MKIRLGGTGILACPIVGQTGMSAPPQFSSVSGCRQGRHELLLTIAHVEKRILLTGNHTPSQRAGAPTGEMPYCSRHLSPGAKTMPNRKGGTRFHNTLVENRLSKQAYMTKRMEWGKRKGDCRIGSRQRDGSAYGCHFGCCRPLGWLGGQERSYWLYNWTIPPQGRWAQECERVAGYGGKKRQGRRMLRSLPQD